jgi:hypothetical protein
MRRHFRPYCTPLEGRILQAADPIMQHIDTVDQAAGHAIVDTLTQPGAAARLAHQPSVPDGPVPLEEPLGSASNPIPAMVDADQLVQDGVPSAPVANPTFLDAQNDVQSQFPLLFDPDGSETAYVGDGRTGALPTLPIDYD